LIAHDVGLAVFGTNSEANSLSVDERMELLEKLVAAQIDPARLMPGTGCCALTDSIRLTRHALGLGVTSVLMLPPFYYKGVSDDGLFRNFAELIERVGDARLKVYLYHIPPVAQVGIGLDLIDRLLNAYPGVIAGIKDSSGDWNNTKAMLERFVGRDFDVFAGSELILLANMRGGGVGCISATANVNPGPINQLYREWQAADADDRQAALNATRSIFQKYPMIPALKSAIASWSGEAAWGRVRPPLVELSEKQSIALAAELRAGGFDMPQLRS
jgi:4-hydroxy-tetrahydrodipicolinate synthase